MKLLVIFIFGYIVYRFCLISSNSDNKDLEDELFIETHKDKKNNK